MNKPYILGCIAFMLIPGVYVTAEARVSVMAEWTQCKRQRDCAAVLDPCGSPASVNKLYVSDYNRWAEEVGPLMDCHRSDCFQKEVDRSFFLEMKDRSLRCKDKECVVDSKKACRDGE